MQQIDNYLIKYNEFLAYKNPTYILYIRANMLRLLYKKTVLSAFMFLFIAHGGLHADIIAVNDMDFADKINTAVNGDTILFDNNYFIFTHNINSIKDISIIGSGSVIDGNQAGRIFEAEGSFGGFDNITLQNGYAAGSGGALHTTWDLTGSINNSTFSDNYASWSGGAIYVYNNFEGNITDSVFSYNNADNYGGAIAAANLFSGFITNGTFIYNKSYDDNYGGGAVLSRVFNATITDSYFAGNIASNGGAVYAENMDSIIKDTNFIDNYAYGRGGAIYILENVNLTLYSTGYMLFSGNGDQSGNNAIYFEGTNGANGTLNIAAAEDAIIEFDDSIDDGAGILSVNKRGNGTLIYNTLMNYKGGTAVHEGALVLNRYGGIDGALDIGDEAALFVNKEYDFTLANTAINRGSLNINLNSRYNLFAFDDIMTQANFNGTLTLTNAAYDMQKEGNYSLILNSAAVSKMSGVNSTLKNLTLNGGVLDAGAFDISISSETLLNVNKLDVGGGTIVINADISAENISIADDVNLYNITNNIYSPLYRLIYAQNGVNTENTELEIINVSDENLAAADIVQNGAKTGEAFLAAAALTENDGVYLGFRLQGVNSLTNVVLDSSDISNNTFNIFLTGGGNFTFTGANQTFIGNYYSDYTGHTILKEGVHVNAISDNAFGYTSSLSLESGTAFDLNGYYQSVGDLNNNGVVRLNYGYINADGFTLNNGIIDLGAYGTAHFNKGASVGDNSLSGYGYIYFNDDFNITGSNGNLNTYAYINGGTVRVNHANSLGDYGYIQLTSSNANIAFDIDGDETLNYQIYGWYGSSLTKEGGGDLTVEGYVSAGLTNILEGALIINPNNFYGDINISSASNLVFNNGGEIYNKLFGGGNITHTQPLVLRSNSAQFGGIYNINNSSLIIASDAALGGDIRADNSNLLTYGHITDDLSLNNSEWTLYKNINMKNLLVSNSNIYFGGQNDDFSAAPAVRLNIDNLNGNGSFYQRLNIQKAGGTVVNGGDIISINNSSYGNYAIHFNDKSTGNFSYQKNAALLVVEQNNPNGEYHADFTGQIDIGAFTYTLWQSNSSTNRNVYLKTSSCSNPACASLAFPNINYAINHVNTDTILQRRGEIDFDRNNKDDFWIKTYMGNLGYLKDDFMIDNIKYYGMNMGIDRSYEDYLLGLTLGYSDTNINYPKGDANSKSYSAGIYALFKNNDKVYLNALVKYQVSKNSFNTETTNGLAVDGDGDASDIILSIELGKRYDMHNTPFYIEPQIQTVFAHHGGMVIESSNGLQTRIDKFQSIRTRLSALFGYKIKENTNIYLKAGYIREFENKAAYSFNHGEKQTYKIDDNIFDSAAGIVLNTDSYGIYLEGAYQKSGIFDNVKANLGYRYKF
jgi:outer membrane autotransporter protein